MAAKTKSRFWRKCRVYFRRFRIAVLLLVLFLLGGIVYLNQIGLPDFIKRPLLARLEDRGVKLEFSRLRLRWYRGIVAENVKFGQTSEPAVPQLSAREVEIDLDAKSLARLHLQVDALNLRDGRLEWTLDETNTAHAITIQNIQTRLRLLPGDEWTLDDFRASFAGANLFLSGSISNASAIRGWKFVRGKQTVKTEPWARRLERLVNTLDTIKFSTPPELRLTVNGDARDLQSFTARLALQATDADTPWGQATNVLFMARIFPGAGRELSHAELSLQAASAHTRWADVAQLNLELYLDTISGNTNLVDASAIVQAASAQTRWANVTNTQFTARWVHSLTNAIPLSGEGTLQAQDATSRWGQARQIRLSADLSASTNAPSADAAFSWWTNALPYQLKWDVSLADLKSEQLTAGKISAAGHWHAPALLITNLHADLHDGGIDAEAGLDIVTREAWFSVRSDFEVKKIAPLLTPGAQRWLAKYSWTTPPHVQGRGAVTLPAWTNRQPDWRGEVRPTLRLAGEFAITNGAYLGVTADWARSRFTYTNLTWNLPDLHASRPDGEVRAEHISHDDTKEYYFRIHSTINPNALRPVLTNQTERGLDYFSFTQSPVIDGEIWGRWREHDLIGFKGSIGLTNFSFRDEHADWAYAKVQYTNRVLEVFEPRIWRGTQSVSAVGITADFNTHRVYFTNGFSTTDPQSIARVIGPKTAKHFEPYHFVVPPAVRVNGFVAMHDAEEADMQFEVTGKAFEWWKFKLPRISGDVLWLNDSLTLTNAQSEFYWGQAAGNAWFDLEREKRGADFQFDVTVTNVNLTMLMADLSSRSNHLEGWLSGRLVVTNANSENSNSWKGFGHAQVQDGLLWELPVFGVLSKPLNLLVPGLGNSRFSQGSGEFHLGEGMVNLDNLEMRSAAMRLQYEGNVRFDGHVDARVEAELFRDAPIIGRLVSFALWPVTKIFEYKITGTLEQPETEPLFIPKPLQLLMSPFQTLGDLLTPDSPTTNSPPFKPVPPETQ